MDRHAVHALAAKSGQRRRVDVQYPTLECTQRQRPDELGVAREHHQLGAVPDESVSDGNVESLRLGMGLAAQVIRRNLRGTGPLEGARRRIVGDRTTDVTSSTPVRAASSVPRALPGPSRRQVTKSDRHSRSITSAAHDPLGSRPSGIVRERDTRGPVPAPIEIACCRVPRTRSREAPVVRSRPSAPDEERSARRLAWIRQAQKPNRCGVARVRRCSECAILGLTADVALYAG
ncbi:MAG: hypothetical protein QOG64_1477 [Acidimicrobiaceae bacterium]|nr:hypothetical protein [Acidimicrobiaceae bacterium]